jgi:F0F1-type ATP synthase assembly protein I
VVTLIFVGAIVAGIGFGWMLGRDAARMAAEWSEVP